MKPWISSLQAAILLVCSFQTLSAEDNALVLADLMGGKQQFNLLSHQTLKNLIKEQPELARHQAIVLEWGKKTLTWERMRAELAKQYHQHFSEPEIQQMILFFRTPAGQKYLRYAPLLKTETVQIGQRLIKANQPELMKRLASESQTQR